MQQRVLTIVLLIAIGLSGSLLVAALSVWRLPDNQQGYAPEQPIAYSHRLHAGDLQIDCKFCHSAAESGRFAGIPAAEVCMKCHRYVTAPYDQTLQELKLADKEGRSPKTIISPELKKLYESLALDEQLKPIPGGKPKPIEWVRVHNLPDYACFNHQAHVSVGVKCQQCHGPVESMERLAQFSTLSMGWCVNCHRDAARNGVNGRPVQASTDCSVCHH
ncbi:MAG: hypothetical protein IT425_14930 [Pirellulales bacterium]|nr:hypothetical protein [Pirellulales bacterium]